LYAVSSTPGIYAVGRASQGVKDAALWSVNRNAAYAIAGRKDPYMVTRIEFARALALALGAIIAGFLASLVGFEVVFGVLAVLSGLMLIPARRLSIGTRGKLVVGEVLRKLDPNSVDRNVWHASLITSCYMITSALIVGFILPIFLNSTGFSYWEVGMVLAVYNGAGAVLLPVTLRSTPSIKTTVIVQLLLYVPAAVLIPISASYAMLAMVVLMALGECTSYIILESLVGRAVAGSKNLATAIGFLFIPGNLAMVAAYAFGGLLVEKFGYVAPFWIAGVFFLIYSLSAWQYLKDRDDKANENP
jgi:predicted MFS family arabinose efflux permease